MPRISDVQRGRRETLDMPGLPWLQEVLCGGLAKGGIYLISGEPGIGKTTLAVQILVDLAKRSIPVVYLTNEQSLADIATVVNRVARGLSGPEADAVKDNLFCDDTVPEIKDLPDFLARRVLSEGQEYTVGACSSTIRSKGVASPPPPPNGTAHSTNSTISPRIPAYVPC